MAKFSYDFRKQVAWAATNTHCHSHRIGSQLPKCWGDLAAGGASQDRVTEEVRPLRQQQLKGGRGGEVGEERLDKDMCKLPMTQIQNQGEKLPKCIIPPATVQNC